MQSQTVEPKVDFSSFSDTIGVLQNILARSQVTMPDFEAPYSPSRFPPANHSAIELKDHGISAIITERQQQLDGVLHEISGLETIVKSINLHKKLVMALWRLPIEVTSQISPETPSLAALIRTSTHAIDQNLSTMEGCCCGFTEFMVQSTVIARTSALPYINKISSLSIHFPLDADKPEHILIDLPALQELTVGVYGRSAIPAIAPSVSRLSFTLRDLKVTWPKFHLEDLSAFNSPLAHFTNLEVVISQMDLVPHLLHLCPNLSS
ncbi:hypothetical protein BDR05DRAFT_1058063 [Suillus weaverae]|nr:hypothetical protein BDR05DRAFT_1058063 [Suillus weaverae]